jgi:threonine/homoserine/homoserine lactone efflux protein
MNFNSDLLRLGCCKIAVVQPIATSLIAFIVAAGLVTMAPGLDSALVLRTAASEGPRQATLTGLGIALGCLVWAAVVAAGLGVLLEASRLAYTALRWIGACYLIWMGYKLLRHPRRAFLTDAPATRPGHASFTRGALTNLLNPKVGVFYVSFLPQFVPTGMPVAPYVMLLGVIHMALGLIWFACLITATRPLARWLQRSAVVTALDRLTGGLFVAFGIGLAAESRRL